MLYFAFFLSVASFERLKQRAAALELFEQALVNQSNCFPH